MARISVDLTIDKVTGETVLTLTPVDFAGLQPTSKRFSTEQEARECAEQILELSKGLKGFKHFTNTPAGQAWMKGTPASGLDGLEGCTEE